MVSKEGVVLIFQTFVSPCETVTKVKQNVFIAEIIAKEIPKLQETRNRQNERTENENHVLKSKQIIKTD